MKLQAAYSIPGGRDLVFQAITDPEVLQKCIDGCQKMVKTSEGNYDVHLKIGVAGMKGNYVGKKVSDCHSASKYNRASSPVSSPGFAQSKLLSTTM